MGNLIRLTSRLLSLERPFHRITKPLILLRLPIHIRTLIYLTLLKSQIQRDILNRINLNVFLHWEFPVINHLLTIRKATSLSVTQCKLITPTTDSLINSIVTSIDSPIIRVLMNNIRY